MFVIEAVEGFAVGRTRVINAYRSRSVETASPGELVLMLYNEALRCMKESQARMETKDYEKSSANLIRAEDILDELRGSIDKEAGGALAQNLVRLYDYAYSALLWANVRKEAAKVDEAINVITELRDGWSGLLHGNG